MKSCLENQNGYPVADALTERSVRLAARALARAGLVHAYGHCSARIDDRYLLVCAAKPMGTIAAGEAGTIVPIIGTLPEGVLGEVRAHQAIYQRRPDVGAVCRIMPQQTMLLSDDGNHVSIRDFRA